MADENNTKDNTDALEATPPTEIAPPKKHRGPRPKNIVSEATAETPEAVAAQPLRGRRKRTDKPADVTVSAKTQAGSRGKAKNVAKGTRKTRVAKQTIETPAPAPILDDIADLLQLEEENARLRKALAEKLRAENADLRKRLGLA